MSIGSRINKLRTKKGISQERLGNDINVSRQAISKWETDESIPSMDNLILLSKYFNVSIDYFILNDEVKLISKDNEKYKTMQMLIKAIEKIALVFLGIIVLAIIIEIIILIIYVIKNGSLPF